MPTKTARHSRAKASSLSCEVLRGRMEGYLRDRALKAREFAAEIGVKPSALSDYVAGRRKKCGREAMGLIKAAFIEAGILPRPIAKRERNLALLRRFHSDALSYPPAPDRFFGQDCAYAETRADILRQMGMPF